MDFHFEENLFCELAYRPFEYISRYKKKRSCFTIAHSIRRTVIYNFLLNLMACISFLYSFYTPVIVFHIIEFLLNFKVFIEIG